MQGPPPTNAPAPNRAVDGDRVGEAGAARDLQEAGERDEECGARAEALGNENSPARTSTSRRVSSAGHGRGRSTHSFRGPTAAMSNRRPVASNEQQTIEILTLWRHSNVMLKDAGTQARRHVAGEASEKCVQSRTDQEIRYSCRGRMAIDSAPEA